MKPIEQIAEYSIFEGAKQLNEDGTEFWNARDLCSILGYSEWRNFSVAIDKAKIACKISGHDVSDHFVGINKMISLAKGAMRSVNDYQLTRYASYLIAMNGDPRKRVIANAQTYFAV